MESTSFQTSRGLITFDKPKIMGILNVTPDSFSDSCRDTEKAVVKGLRLIHEGCDILDIGGESTRPGAEPVSPQQEMDRVLPVIEKLTKETETHLSIDTRHAETARAALNAGASILNHVSATLNASDMVDILQACSCGYIAMHMKSDPRTMQKQARYEDVLSEVVSELEKVKNLVEIQPNRLLFDPGIGFGKNLDHNLTLLRHCPQIAEALGRPLLMGISRKRWMGELLNLALEDRDSTTALTSVMLPFPYVVIHRVHAVDQVKKAFLLKEALCESFG